MKYDVWVHHNGRSAKNAGLISASPLREHIGWNNQVPQYRILGDAFQDHYTVEVSGSNWMLDEFAWVELNKQYSAKHPTEKRPLAGRSYLRECRPSFREAAKTTEGR